MHKYQKYFGMDGVRANLTAWRQAKSNLLTLLRNHPNWNERELAVVFQLNEGRDIDRDVVDECQFGMLDLAGAVEMTPEERADFNAALCAATADYSRTPSEENLAVIRARGHIKCATGQKASRIINKLCIKFHVNTCPQYNSVFARLADSLNPVQISKTGVLSIHPCDFLEMSNRDDAWHSCHCLADGGWKGGCLSYMNDAVSMVFFTVDERVTEHFHKVPKIAREIFCFRDGTLLQSRLYPSDDDDQRLLYRGLVQRTIADCLGVPNLWGTIKQRAEIAPYLMTTPGSLHYTDYNNGSYAILSLLKGVDEHGPLQIGSRALCVSCGHPFSVHSAINCTCDEVVVCKDCGRTVPAQNAMYIPNDNVWRCKSCLHICELCNRSVQEELIAVFDGQGREMQVCAHCYELLQTPCGACSVREVCSIIGGDRFCMRATATNIYAATRAA